MKKFLSFLFICLMALVFVGCSGTITIDVDDPGKDPENDPGTEPTTEVINPTAVDFMGKKSEVIVGDEFTLTLRITPSNAKGYKTTWESSNPSVASVDAGVVKALSVGTTEIKVTAGEVTNSFELTVKNPPKPDATDLLIYYSEEEFLIGETERLSVEIDPSEASQEVVWSFDKEGIVSIDENNVLTALKGGLVTITCSSKSNPDVKDSYQVRVYDNVEGMEIVAQGTMMKPGNKQTLTVELLKKRKDGTEIVNKSEIKWESTNPDVVSVASDGLVTAIKDGTATIKAIAQDSGHFTAEIVITVASTEIKIGDVKYGSVKDAIKNAKAGDTIEIGKGSISEEFEINKSGLTFKGNDSTLKGHIEIADGVSDIKFETLIFSDLGYITAQATGDPVGVKGITFDKCEFNNVASKSDGTIHFFVPVEDFTFTNNKATFASNRGIRFEAAEKNALIDNNEFVGVAGVLYDMVRWMDVASGTIAITNNVFDTTTQSHIQIKYITNATYNINNNTFKNAANVSVDLREAVDDNITKATINVKYNEFNGGANSWSVIRLRNSSANGKLPDPSKVEVNINYNKFIGINVSSTAYVDKPTDNCTEGLFNIDNNYSDQGAPQAAWFNNMQKSMNGWTTSTDELDNFGLVDKINSEDKYLVVGTHKDVTKTGYATLAEALKKAKAGDIIVLLPGTHSGDVMISVPNLTITSLNGGNNPLSDNTREDEAIFTGTMKLGVELEKLTIKGIKFTGAAQISNNKANVGTAENTTTNLDGFTFTNNIVEVSTGGNGFIYFVESASSYSHDLIFTNNSFKAASGFSAKAMVWIDNNYNLTVTGNLFSDIKADYAFYVNDETKGMSGQFSTIENNTFKNIDGSALHINWLSPLPLNTKTCKVSIQNNTFNTVTNNGIYIGQMNNADIYEYIKVMFNEFTAVSNAAIHFQRVTGNANISARYNIFNDNKPVYYFNNNSANTSTSGGVALDATDCLFLKGGKVNTVEKYKIGGDVNYTTSVTSRDDIPDPNSKATGVTIKGATLNVGETKQLEVEYTPKNTANIGVTWSVSDTSIATITADGVIKGLKSGKVTVTATYVHNATVKGTAEVTFTDWQDVELTFSGSGILSVEDQLTMTAKVIGSITTGEIEWSTSNANIATVENGKVKALAIGNVVITAKIKGTEIKQSVTLQVKEKSGDSEIDKLLDLLTQGHRAVVENMGINYIGYEAGYEKVFHNVYQSVNAYYASTLPSIIQNPCTNDTTSGTMKSIEFIVVHDTGAASPSSTAKANSNWCTNKTNTSSSWHYTVGNDGIYQQLADNVVAWHAGDGTGWGDTTTLTNTGVKADPDLRNRAKVTLGSDGYFYVNGTKTNIPLPSGATSKTGTNELGLAAVVKDGYYYLPTTWISSGYGKPVCIRGGNLNGIGIESAVNTGSDVYLTWQRLAKFVATLLVKHNLTPERVLFHNNFSNKTCPNTMITNNRVEMFLDMVYLEYYIAKNYSGYTITFTSNNPDIIDNSGRVVGKGPSVATTVTYTITVTKGSESKSITLTSLVQAAK